MIQNKNLAQHILKTKNPTRCIFGPGSLSILGDELRAMDVRRLLFVAGIESLRSSTAYPLVRAILDGFDVVEAPSVAPNPDMKSIEYARQGLNGYTFDAVVGIGGGSTLDAAKALAFVLARPGFSLEANSGTLKDDGIRSVPLVAVPTTAGSGSEATQFSSLLTEDGRKVSIDSPRLYPRVAIIDPELTRSLPPYVTAYTGFDVLCQAVESAWSVRTTPASAVHALRAIPLVLAHLERAVRDPADVDSRAAMSLASCEAGLAISQTRTTAVHAASYPLTGLYGIPHGHACALTLAPFIRYNAPALEGPKGARLWAAMGAVDAQDAASAVERLMVVAVGLECCGWDASRVDREGIEPRGRTRFPARPGAANKLRGT